MTSFSVLHLKKIYNVVHKRKWNYYIEPFFLCEAHNYLNNENLKLTKKVVWGLSPKIYGFWVTSHKGNPVAFNYTDLTEQGFSCCFSGVAQNWALLEMHF